MRACLLLGTFLWCGLVHADEAGALFESVRPSVVSVKAMDEHEQPESEGSGVVVGVGQVVTNCHVVQAASAIRVQWGEKVLRATLTLQDIERDLCRLDVSGLEAPAVKLRSVRDVRVGEAVYAVGNPLGLGLAVSAGIVSRLHEAEGKLFILSSASVSPGSSGGGLFDANGRLIGITTLRFGRSYGFNVSMPADWIGELAQRGKAPMPSVADPGPDPDWVGEADKFREAQDWAKLEEWARRWRLAYPTSVAADSYYGLALLNQGQIQRARQILLGAVQRDPSHAIARGYLFGILLANGEKDAASTEIRKAIALYPSNGSLWHSQALLQVETGRRDEALASAQQAVRFKPWDENVWQSLAELLHGHKRYEEAVRAYRIVLKFKPEHAIAKSNLAAVLASTGQTSTARQVLAGASLTQADAGTWMNVGVGEEKKLNFTEAERAYRKAIEIAPAMPEAWYALATSLMRTNRHQEAEQALRQAIKHKPDFAAAWGVLGNILSLGSDKKSAKEAYEKSALLDPSALGIWFSVAAMRSAQGDIPGAITALEKETQNNPKHAAAWTRLGEFRFRMGKSGDTLSALKQAEALDAKDVTMLQAFTMYYGAQGQSAEALAYAERAIALNSADPVSWSNKGYSLLKLGRLTDAVAALETATRLQPDLAVSWINLGNAFLQQKQLGKAIEMLEKALTLAPSAIDARLYLVQAYAASSQFAKAKAHLDVLAGNAPNHPGVWYLLAAVQLAQNNRQGVVEAYSRLKKLNPSFALNFREKTRMSHPTLLLPE